MVVAHARSTRDHQQSIPDSFRGTTRSRRLGSAGHESDRRLRGLRGQPDHADGSHHTRRVGNDGRLDDSAVGEFGYRQGCGNRGGPGLASNLVRSATCRRPDRSDHVVSTRRPGDCEPECRCGRWRWHALVFGIRPGRRGRGSLRRPGPAHSGARHIWHVTDRCTSHTVHGGEGGCRWLVNRTLIADRRNRRP